MGNETHFTRDEEGAAQIRRQLVVRVQTNHLGVAQTRTGEFQQHGRECGGNQHGLAVSGQLHADLVQLGRKAQFKQLVGLIVADVRVKNVIILNNPRI